MGQTWKHIPANSKYTLKEGDIIRTRCGNHVQGQYKVFVKDSCMRVFDFNGDAIGLICRAYNYSRTPLTRQSLSDYGEFAGMAIDLLVDETWDMPKSRWVLSHKPNVRLVNGLKLKFEPYRTSADQNVYEATVSIHGDICQVHIRCNNVGVRAVTFTLRPFERTVADLTFFERFACYIEKKVEKIPPEVPQPTIADLQAKLVERDQALANMQKELDKLKDTGLARYIIWCPTSDLPPTNIFVGENQAKAVAAKMAEKHPGKEFIWCRLTGNSKAVMKTVTVERQVTEFKIY